MFGINNDRMLQDLARQAEQAEREKPGHASDTFRALQAQLKEEQEALSQDEELGVLFGSDSLHIRTVFSRGKTVIVLECVDQQQQPSTLVLHHTQLVLRFVRVKPLQETPHRIGFE